jgi:hypothetical protein
VSISINSSIGLSDDMLTDLRHYAENFEPSYVEGNEQLVVARISDIPDSLNNYLYYCIENDENEASKYAYLVIMKLKEEFMLKNNSDYNFCHYENNGIVDLVFYKIGAERDPIGCAFTKTYEIYKWLLEHPDEYIGYQPLELQIKKISGLLSEK